LCIEELGNVITCSDDIKPLERELFNWAVIALSDDLWYNVCSTYHEKLDDETTYKSYCRIT